ncbi:MAG: RagB/SusD family nutrient uptake outer membrane protein [Muribaculaceae bacterium]|nr:RagB/SusD family nutrient uptake outer membrane protein [Muribaculaceae bacterium]
MVSCDDFLDKNRYPLDIQTDQPAYWNNKVNVEAQLDAFYGYYTGYGNGASWVNDFYYRSLNDDQCAQMNSGSGVVFTQWPYQYAPVSNSVWDATYVAIRKCNTIVIKVEGSTLSEPEKLNYTAIARLNRAYQYWDLVRNIGDVPLIEGILDTDSEELYGPRTPRNEVMDYVLKDINFACENIAQQSNKIEFSKDMANAMKAEICLYEAAFAKYHQHDNARATKYYQEVVNACNNLMGKYEVCDDYRSLFNSMWAADSEKGYVSLRDNGEVIFMKGYLAGTLGHSMIKYLSSNTPIAGMTKDAFDAYLFKDGKPLATTGEVKDDAAVPTEDGLSIEAALAVRDNRLAQTIDSYLAFNGNSHQRPNSDPLASNTGYTIKRFVNPGMSYDDCTTDGRNATCAPIYWMAEIYLALAEAKAELGTLTDADLDNTINKLFKRAELPARTVAELNAINDPANNAGVSSLIWEIRRCRRCELMFCKNARWWDMIRWHQLDKLDTVKYPNTAMGANVSKASAEQVKNVSVTNGYIDAAKNSAAVSTRIYNEREYLQPIGTTQLRLNKQLEQNPGWGTGN